MPYKEQIKQQCEELSNQELLTVVNNKLMYNELIVTTAKTVLKKRNVSKEEQKAYSALEKSARQYRSTEMKPNYLRS